MTGMRILLTSLLLLAGLGSVSCMTSSGECSPVEIGGEGDSAGGTSSCAYQIAIGDTTYVPEWCTPVRHEALGAPIAAGDGGGLHLEARLLIGIPQEQAIALHTSSRYTSRAEEHRCGRWSFTPATELDRSAQKSLARSVAEETSADQR